jgi:hypothetical protein
MNPVLIAVIVVVVLGVVIALFGWDRYRGHSGAGAGTGYRPTDEVFDDPQTGKRMRVWYDAASGRREYRPE